MKFLAKTLLWLTMVAAVPSAAQASLIVVLDSGNGGTEPVGVFDRSDGGDTAAGVTGAFAISAGATTPGSTTLAAGYWGAGNRLFIQAGTTVEATFTLRGLQAGANYEVFASWRNDIEQTNLSSDAPYTVNGVAAPDQNQEVIPPAGPPVGVGSGFTLTDDGAVDINFGALGSFAADGTGQIQVVVAAGNEFTAIDAIAIRGPAKVPEPASWALLLGGIGLIGCRRWRRKS